MNLFLTLAFLFFIGSVFGWVLELFFRKFFSSSNPEHKWINPGFCTGPYLPIYGFGLCALYLLARIGDATGLDNSLHGKAVLFVGMAVSMTLIEYIGGLMLLKGAKIRLWDYSNCWGGRFSAPGTISLCIRIFSPRFSGFRRIWLFLL